jgi:Protein of unknown function (DUF2934)
MSHEQSVKPREVTEQEIALRAYEKWQRRGCPLGSNSEDDWYAARAELERELSLTVLCEPAPSITTKVDTNDNLHVQLRKLVQVLVNESPRPAIRRSLPAPDAAARLRA